MSKNDLGIKIRGKALELGFEACGIIKLDAIRDFSEKLDERIEVFPESKPMYEMLRKYSNPDETYDWAKSIVVCITRYGRYNVPKNLEGIIGKYYLYDYKLQNYSREFESQIHFEDYLKELGMKTAKELNGITSMRWAAYKAGLGVIRKNNFFYTKNGSWVLIDTWLVDEEIELIEESTLKKCPENCTKCVDACPTKALSQPYCTNMASCITRLTWGLKDLPDENLRTQMGKWVYGCDACQNACPMNSGCWEEVEEYPQLEELAAQISLEKIMDLDETSLKKLLMPKFFFIQEQSLWLWKANVLRAMTNSYEPKYEKYILEAKSNENEKIRQMALWACSKLGIS